MTLYIGTSGFAYREWKPDFYPAELAQTRYLEHYCKMLSACELNATFYRLHTDAAVGRWAALAPESFRFAAKAHRAITHSRVFPPDHEGRSFLDTFLRSLSPLGPRLGAVLFQLPQHRPRDDAALEAFLRALPAGTNYAIEFRDPSWDAEPVRDLVAGHGATVCVSDTGGDVPSVLPVGPIAYVRLRRERYGEEERAAWLKLLTTEAEHRNVYAFSKHEGIATSDPCGGIGLARWLTANA